MKKKKEKMKKEKEKMKKEIKRQEKKECEKTFKNSLFSAVARGNLDDIKALVDQGALDAMVDDNNINPLHFAVMKDNLDIVKDLVEKGASMEAIDDENYTPLSIAAAKGLLDIVKYLVDKGANMEIVTAYKMTPLHDAVIHDHIDVVKYLVEHGANMEALDHHNNTPLQNATEYNNTEIAKYLVNHLEIMEKLVSTLMKPEEIADTEVKIAAKEESENRCSACCYCNKQGKDLLEETGNQLLKCSSCMTATYCNRDCQVAHYKEHKTLCKALASFRPDKNKGNKLIEFNEMNRDILCRQLFPAMLNNDYNNLRTGNKSMDHVAVVIVDYNYHTNAFRIVEHELVPDKDIISYFQGNPLHDHFKTLNDVRKHAQTSASSEDYSNCNVNIGFVKFKNGTEAFRRNKTKVLMSVLASIPDKEDKVDLHDTTAKYGIHRINLLDPAYAKSPEAFQEALRLADSVNKL